MTFLSSSLLLLGLSALADALSSETKFSEYILAPASRIVKPVGIYQVKGDVERPESLLENSKAGETTSFHGPHAYVTYDFGKNVGGWVNFAVDDIVSSDKTQTTLTVTFTESSLYISPNTSDGIGNTVGNMSFSRQ